MAKKIAVLKHNSLLAAGFISRLNGYARQFEILIVDLKEPDSLDKISDFKPDFLIFDDADIKNSLYPTLVDILDSCPDAILLELRIKDSNIQIIHSYRFSAANAAELINMLNSGGNLSSPTSHLIA